MFKKLDKLIIKAFIGPFIAIFFIMLLVLVIQFFWLYIDDFVGKGLDTNVILEFIWYQSASLIPLALPLAVLFSSLMTFGNLGERFELVAIKSSGISLMRFIRPLLFVVIFICGIAFVFSNYIIPVAYLKSRTLLIDIVRAKPAFDLREGVFYDKISGFAIKIGKKEKNDSIIHDVIVYEQGYTPQDNFIVAKRGIMRTTTNKRFLEFTLEDGWRYQEKLDNSSPDNTQYIRVYFREFKKQFDLSSFQFNRTSDTLNRNNEKLLSMRQLKKTIDSLKKDFGVFRGKMDRDNYLNFQFVKNLDTTWEKKHQTVIHKAEIFEDILPDSARNIVSDRAISQINAVKARIEISNANLAEKESILTKHQMEWHRKISLSIACLLFFLIGAPLGSIIQKGGFGLPMIFALFFFMLFYFSGTTGEKLAKNNTLSPFVGMWQSTFVLAPIGIFLTYKAMRDSQLFNKEFYYRIRKQIAGFLRRKTEK